MDAQTFESWLRDPVYLPSSRSVVWELLRSLDKPDVPTAEVQELVSRDQGLVARMLKLANSPFFGVSRQVNSLPDAVVVLGLMNVRRLAIAASLLEEEAELLQSYWKHSLRIAYLSESIAHYTRATPAICFVYGLLRHIGLLVFYGHDAAFGPKLIHPQEQGPILLAEQQQTYGFDHLKLGCQLLESWRLPSQLSDAISRCYAEPPAPYSSIALCSQIADHWVTHAAREDGEDFTLPQWMHEQGVLHPQCLTDLASELGRVDEGIRRQFG
ncbi:HDOD domain-containing protein [Chitinimonas sp.]|uniref:HDOD domain-containing protein n=1 Tax=Chitinimonas sp. TaxID=1934313 RepID=UPI002F95AF03